MARFFVYGDQNGLLTVWDVPAKRIRATLNTSLSSSIVALAIDASESRIAFGTLSGRIGILRILADRLSIEKVFSAHYRSVHALAFDPKDGRLASGGADRTVRLRTSGGEPLRILGKHDDYVVSAAFSPDGSTLATGGADGAIRVWNPSSFQQTDLLSGHLGMVSSLGFSSDGNLIVSGSEDKTVRIWDRVIGKEIVRLRSNQAITAVTFVGQTKKILAGDDAGVSQSWDLSTRQEGYTLYDNFPISSVAFHPDGNRIASAGLGQ